MSLFVFKNKRKAIFLSVLFGIVGISFINSTVADASDTYYLARKAELDNLYPSSSTVKFPMIVKTMNTSDRPYTQYITFGAFNKDKKEPYSISDAFGTTSGSIQGNPFVNIVNEMAPGDFSSNVTDAFSKKNDSAGLSVQLASSTQTIAKRMDFFSNKTTTYSFKDDNGKDVIKLLSNAKNDGADYTVEQTIVSDPSDPEVEVTTKVTNATGQMSNFGIAYGFSSEIKGSGMATLSNTFSHYKDMGGFYSEAPMNEPTKIVSSKIKFPKELSDVPDDWALQDSQFGPVPYRAYRGYSDVGQGRFTIKGKGMSGGFTKIEADNNKSYAEFEKPYLDRVSASVRTASKEPVTGVNMKKTPVNIANDKDLSFQWKMSFTEEKLKRAENSIYNEFDKESKTSLDNFSLINKIPPLEVNTSSLDDITEVKNFLIFGNQNTGKDTLPQIASGIQSQQNDSAVQSDINKAYRNTLNVGINTPRVITYKKGSVNDKPTSYSYRYEEEKKLTNFSADGNSSFYGGSGFGLATFENGHVRVPVSNVFKMEQNKPNEIPAVSTVNSSMLDEVYRSKDGKTLKLYGRYLMGNGTWIPMCTTVSNIGSIGKVRITFQYQNKLGFKTDFNSYFSNHMDINGQHTNSRMLTLGDMNGIFFNQKGLMALGTKSNYFVAFYTYNSNRGRAPKTITTTSYSSSDNLPEDAGHSITYPRNWDAVGGEMDEYTPAFYRGQLKGEEIERRDYKTGKLKPGKNRYPHPGWSFVYSPEPLDVDKVGSSTLEMKVSDIPDIDYSGVKINPESNKVITKKEDLVIKPTYTQKLDSPVSNQFYKPEYLEIFIPNDSYPKVRDNQYKVSMDGKALVENVDYQKYIDNTTNSTVIKLMDKFLWDNKEEGKDIRKDIVVEQVFDIGSSQEIVKFYDKSTSKFAFDLKSYNVFKIANSDEPKEEQNPHTNAKQYVSYVPDFSAVAKTNTAVNSGTIAPNDPSEFLTLSYNKVFDFDNLEVNYENNVKPVFQGDGMVKFNVVVQSKSFGNPKTVPVEVKVTSNVEMAVHRYLNEKDGTKTNKIKNLKDGSLNDISESPTKVKKLDNFNDILNKLKNDPFLGYEYVSLIVKLKDGTVINDTSKVPESDFVVDLYYKGQVLLDSPQSFDFGEHKLDVRGSSQIEPIISKDGNTDKTKTKMQVINTQGNGSGWKLYASQTKEMKKGNTTFKGSLYYIPKAGDTPIIIDKIAKPINPIEKSKDAAIVNSIPLQSVDANNKTGILVDIYPGNQLGDYTSGEVTWNLQDAL